LVCVYNCIANICCIIVRFISDWFNSTFVQDRLYGHGQARSDVMLVSYMRSGSSALGRLLGHRNDTFFVYEPLWKLHTWTFLTGEKHDIQCSMLTPDCKWK